MEYKFNLEPDFENGESYEEGNNNILEVRVYDKDSGKELKNCYVTLSLSKNGMIGMGENLIRFAQDFHEARHVHLDPSTSRELLAERLGVFTTPQSIPTIVCCAEFGTIDEEIITKI